MRRWKIGQVRNLIFDGGIAWLVVGRPRHTRLIRFDPNTDETINSKKPSWQFLPRLRTLQSAYQGRYFDQLVRPVGPPSARTAFVHALRWFGSDVPDVGVIINKTANGGLTSIQGQDGFVALPPGGIVAEFDDNRRILINQLDDGKLAILHSGGDRDKYVQTCGDWMSELNITPHGVVHYRPHSYGQISEFIASDGSFYQSVDSLILDVAGDLKLERDRPTHRTGSFVMVAGQKYVFTDRVYGGLISPDCLTAFVWGTSELVQFDLG